MNPSSSNWIPKYLNNYNSIIYAASSCTIEDYYNTLKATGFIYGAARVSVMQAPISDLTLTKEEFTKVNLFHSLLYVYYSVYNSQDSEEAIKAIIQFYKTLEKSKSGLFSKIKFANTPSQNLEKLLAARLNETNSKLKYNSTAILTYALLFVDVLAFKRWLINKGDVKTYTEKIEALAISCCYFALQSKKQQKKYDILLIELFETSKGYSSQVLTKDNTMFLNSGTFSETTTIEKIYLLDLCCIAVWDDRELDTSEFTFLKNLVEILDLPEDTLHQSISAITGFTSTSDKKLKLFEYVNPVKLFYKQASGTVKLLILRNKKRLLQELNESGELVVLLSSSTIRDLTRQEKDKVKEQLLDICKTIPSLAIFILPGGTVLLPLLVKFIPKLLPSAFQENRIDEVKK